MLGGYVTSVLNLAHTLAPWEVGSGSRRRIWWCCLRSHQRQADVALAATHPEVARGTR